MPDAIGDKPMFLKTIDEDDATGRVAEIYAAERDALGFVMSATLSMTARPDLLPLYQDFFDQIRAKFSLPSRDWRLITFVAAQQVPSTYCATVYGKRLAEDLGSKDGVLALLHDFRTAGLSDRDVAMLAYAEMVAKDASAITQDDVDTLRAEGFTDVQIADIALCASVRCFFSRYIDATGARPEDFFLDGDEAFRDALAVGRKP